MVSHATFRTMSRILSSDRTLRSNPSTWLIAESAFLPLPYICNVPNKCFTNSRARRYLRFCRQTRTSVAFIASRLPCTLQLRCSSSAVRLGPVASNASMADSSANRLSDFGKMGYGCKHYRRRCKIRAPCCNQVFPCRHCHNEAMSMLHNCCDPHELCRYDVRQVICSVCDTEQEVAKVCANCGVNMGEYFCEVCKFYDDDTEKKHFHCDKCGICRVGGRENFFHCQKCGSCYSNGLINNHLCVENSMRHHCPICYEYLFDSLKETTVLKCGHTIHSECLYEMKKHDKYSCPICCKSVVDMTRYWNLIDEEVQATTMPEDYRYRKVWILCNDCNDTTEVFFHIIGHKCLHCNSYNTRVIAPPSIH